MNSAKCLAAVVLIGASMSVMADEVLQHSYQQQADATSCPSSFACIVTFPASPYADLIIKHVSCEIEKSDGQPAPTNAALLNGHYVNELPIFPAGADAWALNVDTYLFFKLGETPQIVVSGSTTSPYFQCTISGYHSEH